jgi:site-specific DNA recombinase
LIKVDQITALSAELFIDRAAFLRLVETLTAFPEHLRTNVQTLDIGERQPIMRLLVKEVILGKDLITIKHSIPCHSDPSGGNPASSKPFVQSGAAQPGKSYALCTWRDQSAVVQPISASLG